MTIWVWLTFVLFVLSMLALDLGFVHRRPHEVSTSEAVGWTVFWVCLALLFNAGLFYAYEHHWLGIGLEVGHPLSGRQAVAQFFTGYLIEKSLSLDNVFVIAMIFSYFRIPAEYQHRLLFWGVLGALVLRGLVIAGGLALIERVDWMVYVFGGLLLVTAVKMLVVRHDNLEPERNPGVRLLRRLVAVTPELDGPRLVTRIGGRRAATPLLVALILIESTDLLFALDSVPAILAVTRDPFLVYTSNVFAILGLRSLYFVLASVMERFRFLKTSLAFLLAFVGVKMMLAHHYPIPTGVSLAVIGSILFVGLAASIVGGHRDTAPLASPLGDELVALAQLTYRKARRLVVLVFGSTLLLIGAALIVLPGPGIPVLFLGLALLATEFVWARRLLRQARKRTARFVRTARRMFEDAPPPKHGQRSRTAKRDG